MANVHDMGNDKYRVIVSNGYDGEGNRIRKTTTIRAKSKEMAILMAEEMEQKFKEGKTYDFNNYTFSYLIDKYVEYNMQLDEKGDGITKAVSTIVKDMNAIEEIRKHLGKYKLRKLTSIAIREYISSLSKDGARRDGKAGGLSPKTIKNRYGLVSVICKYGVDNGWMKENPCKNMVLPKYKIKEPKSYTEDEVEVLLEKLESVDIKHKVLVNIALTCGLRRGELMGIEWKDINFEKKYIDIRRGSQYIQNQGTRETGLKTEKSYRSITVPNGLIEILMEYKKWQDNEKEKAGDLWVENDRLFVNDIGEPLNPDSMYQWWTRFLKRNGLRHMSLHGLRHTSISILISNNEDIVEVSRRSGHSKVGTTLNKYSHLFKDMNRRSADILDRVIYKK